MNEKCLCPWKNRYHSPVVWDWSHSAFAAWKINPSRLVVTVHYKYFACVSWRSSWRCLSTAPLEGLNVQHLLSVAFGCIWSLILQCKNQCFGIQASVPPGLTTYLWQWMVSLASTDIHRENIDLACAWKTQPRDAVRMWEVFKSHHWGQLPVKHAGGSTSLAFQPFWSYCIFCTGSKLPLSYQCWSALYSLCSSSAAWLSLYSTDLSYLTHKKALFSVCIHLYDNL